MKRKPIAIVLAALLLLSVFNAGARDTLAETAQDDTKGVLTVFECDFETDPIVGGWTLIDADGDGDNWRWSNLNPHDGEKCLVSVSNKSTPDNWAITPAIELPADGYAVLRFYMRNHHSQYPEKYRLYVGTSANIEDMEPLTDTIIAMQNDYKHKTIELDAYAGQTVYIGFRHCDVNDMFRLHLDDVLVEVLDEPYDGDIPENLIFGSYFETDPAEDGWTFVDADGDGYNWYWSFGLVDSAYAYDGQGYLASNSWIADPTAHALDPDNWAIVGPIQLKKENNYLSFYGRKGLGYHSDAFAVYLGTTNVPDEMTEIYPWSEGEDVYENYTIGLDEYAGQEVYIAIRHFDCNDQFRFLIDNFEVFGEGETEPEPGLLLGDTDLDGDVDIEDVLLTLRGVLGIVELTDEQALNAEVSGNGSVDLEDVMLILRKVVGIIAAFPAEEN